MSWENRDVDDIISRSSTETYVDEGLRSYMLKVYNYMTLGLTVTAFVSWALSISSLGLLFFHANGQPNFLGWIAVFAPFVLLFMLNSAVYSGNATKAFVLFMLYSGLLGVSLTTIFWVYTGLSILRVLLITAATFAATSLYGYTTKRDLTSFGHFMTMGLIGIIISMLVNLFLQSPALYYATSVIGVVVFVGLTAWDTYKIREIYAEGDAENQVTSKAVYGAFMLYLDFINLFLMMLRFFGQRRD